ncbi:MAG: C25 family cysteine peptidase, partial [Candidatus Hinthialibacter sp.]
KLVLNYPPLRTAPPDASFAEAPPYFQTPAMKIRTRQSGVLSVPSQKIHQCLSPNLRIEDLALFRGRAPIPFIALDAKGRRKTSGPLQADDFLQFYAPLSASPYSPETVVWLAPLSSSHRPPSVVSEAESPPDGETPLVLEKTIVLEEDHIFMDGQDKNETQSQHWMWHDFISESTKTLSFTLPQNIVNRSASAALRIVSNQAYVYLATSAVYAELNNRRLPFVLNRMGSGEFQSSLIVEPGILAPGANTLILALDLQDLSSRSDLGVYLDKIEWRIAARPAPCADPYRIPQNRKWIDLPQSHGGVWLAPRSGAPDAWYAPPDLQRISCPKSPESWDLYILPETLAESPVECESISSPLAGHPLLVDHEGADVLLVAPREWIPILQPFEQDLRRRGYRVRKAAVEDVYDLFGDGRMAPQHLRDFLRYACHYWRRPQPSYILLIGDATWDYWGRYNNGVRNFVPGYREDPKYAVENWFVRCDDPADPFPDAIIARWPVQSASDLRVVVEKTLRYKNEPPLDSWLNTVFVLTDDTFERYSQELIDEWIPPGMRTLQRHIADYPLIDNIYLPERLRKEMRAKTSLEATKDIINIVSRGVFLWNYFGHGAPNVLGEERMFFGGGSKHSDVKKLTNQGKLPMLWAFTCETAKFDYARDKWNISIGEDMLTFPGGGMIALVGATGRGYPTDHVVLARGMHQAAFRDRFSTLGQIFYAACLYGAGQMFFFEPMNQFAVLGDPTIRMPEFHSLPGEAQWASDDVSFRWSLESGGVKTMPFQVWAEDGKTILSDTQLYRQTRRNDAIEGVFSVPPDADIHKIGLDSIRRDQDRVLVAHGSVLLSKEIQSASFVEPATGRLPDLCFVPDSLTVEPSSPRSGETIFLNALVRNDGAASARDIFIQGRDASSGNSAKILNVVVGRQGASIDRLDPGQQKFIRLRWDPTNNAGPHKLRLTIDSNNRIAEFDEENNTIESEIQVRRKADLLVDPARFDARPIEGGKRQQIYFEVCNQGESPADRIVIELQRKDAGTAEPESIRLPQAYEIQPGAHRSFGGVKIPAGIEYLEIIVDPDEIIDEETHENNRYRYEPQ